MRQYVICFILCGLLLLSWKASDYEQTCANVWENLDARSKIGLTKLLGKHTLEELAANMPEAARDSIDYYVKPLDKLNLGGSYRYKQLDSVIRPLNLQILNGISKFEETLRDDDHNTTRQRLFALQVLIGLHTAMQLPLTGVTRLLPRDEFLKHDIFIRNESPKYSKTSLTTGLLYSAYKLGVRVAQAKGNQQWINSFMDQGYQNAGRWLAGSIKQAFNRNILEIGEPNGFGKIIEPGKDPVYLFLNPQFPGGINYFNKFMDDHLIYPEEEWDKGIEGNSMVQILVEKDGSISNIKVVNPITPGIDSVMVRAIKLSPKWHPAHLEDDSRPVRATWICIVSFKIRPDRKREDAFDIPFQDASKPHN